MSGVRGRLELPLLLTTYSEPFPNTPDPADANLYAVLGQIMLQSLWPLVRALRMLG